MTALSTSRQCQTCYGTGEVSLLGRVCTECDGTGWTPLSTCIRCGSERKPCGCWEVFDVGVN